MWHFLGQLDWYHIWFYLKLNVQLSGSYFKLLCVGWSLYMPQIDYWISSPWNISQRVKIRMTIHQHDLHIALTGRCNECPMDTIILQKCWIRISLNTKRVSGIIWSYIMRVKCTRDVLEDECQKPLIIPKSKYPLAMIHSSKWVSSGLCP